MTRRPGWERLWQHSYRLGWRWLVGGLRRGWKGARVGLCRLLVPLDPWRYYELGKVADEPFDGLNLDVSSPKLLASLLRHEGRGEWIGIDLFREEIENWRYVDPGLRLEVADVRQLPWDDATFDGVVSISVVEHLAEDGDRKAMAEMWRVLKPGGMLYLTTNVATMPRQIWREDRVYGEASTVIDGKVFFERHYSPQDLERRLLRQPWEIVHREFARENDPSIQDRFYGWAPWSYLYGGLLRRSCPQNFLIGETAAILGPRGHGVVYLKLRKAGLRPRVAEPIAP